MAPIVSKLAPSDVFKAYCLAGEDRKPYVLDLRSNKEFKKGHLSQSFNIVVSKNGRILADYSKATYKEVAWSQNCCNLMMCALTFFVAFRWDKDVIVYSNETVRCVPLKSLLPLDVKLPC
eukprot:5294807-Pyramimonas_sp.AAC.2